jgi:CubicO group peptidase (beta-lactamase class C family)
MRLVDTGALDLDEAMSTYNPGYSQWCAELKARGVPAARDYNCDIERITVRHHLTHTAEGKPGTQLRVQWFCVRASDSGRGCRVCKGFCRSIEDDILDPLGMKSTRSRCR